jgi:hypothetical protein
VGAISLVGGVVEARLVVREAVTPSLLVLAGVTATSSGSGAMGVAAAGATIQAMGAPRGGMRRPPHKDLGRTRLRLPQSRAAVRRNFSNNSALRGNRLLVMFHAFIVAVMPISLLVALLFAVKDVGN